MVYIDKLQQSVNTLFPNDIIVPDGFHYFPDFLTEREEQQLINDIGDLELHTLIFRGFEAKRKVNSYGYDYQFDTRSISRGEDIPPAFNFLLEKISTWLSIPLEDLAEVLVTEYPPGSVINWHRDAPPFDIIVGVSLMSDCRFKLRPYDKAKQGRKSIITIPVRRRSIYVIRDEARTHWEHCIAPVTETRYSITVRTLIDNYKDNNFHENSNV